MDSGEFACCEPEPRRKVELVPPLRTLPRISSLGLLVLILAALLPHPAVPEPLSGTLHPRASEFPPETIGTTIWGDEEPIGHFSLDLDLQPDATLPTITLSTASGGRLFGMAMDLRYRIAGPFRDSASRYAIRTDAMPSGVCFSGVEPACWKEGDPPLPADGVVETLCAALDFDLPRCPFWTQRLRAPFRSGPFGPLESVSGPTALPGFGLLIITFTGEDEPSGDELPPPEASHGLSPAAAACLAHFAPAEVNLPLQLACLSEPAVGEAPGALDVIDPDALFSQEPGRCSLSQPQFCRLVEAFFQDVWSSRRVADAPDVFPFAPSFGAWIWESGAEYAVLAADGEFAPYAGGTVFALGPERPRTGGASSDTSAQADGTSEPALSNGFTLLVRAAGSDPDATIFFGVAPEPGAPLLVLASVATLTALARRR